jgi:hypothetical protein
MSILMGSLPAWGAKKPYVFDWSINDTDQNGLPAIPFPSCYGDVVDSDSEIYHELYADQDSKNAD